MASLNHPGNVKYSKTDEWVRLEGDRAVIGITDYAQDQLGDIVYVELPWELGSLALEGKFGDIESVKATSELISPLAGEVVEVNEALKEHPELINDDPYGEGWMLAVKVTDSSALNELLDVDAYLKHLEGR